MDPFENLKPPFEWSQYRAGVPWVPSRTIFVTRHGSHAYGTNLATSDLDLRGILVPPKEYLLGNLYNFDQIQNRQPVKGEDATFDEIPDFVIFAIQKFFKIAVECNPNALELLFTDEQDHLLVTPVGQELLEHRQLFLTRRARHTFSGYAISQLKRIKGHYKWLKDPPKAPPTRSELGLPERTIIPADQLAAANAAIQKKLDQWNFVGLEDVGPDVRIGLQSTMAELLAEMKVSTDSIWVGAARMLGFSDNFIELLDLERRYAAKKREWDQYQGWLKNRNPDRAILEARYGYDTKHAMHLVRLLRVCREILTEGVMRVRRPDFEELLEIRAGAWAYERLVEWAEAEDIALGLLVADSPLPASPPRKELDQLLVRLIEKCIYA
jgi:hypothetical protein